MFRNSAMGGLASGNLQRPAIRVIKALIETALDTLDRVALAVLTYGYSELGTTGVRPERKSVLGKSKAPFTQGPDK